jgi:hypothetical protein
LYWSSPFWNRKSKYCQNQSEIHLV